MSARSEAKRGIDVPHDRMLSTLVTAAKLLFDASRNPDFTKDSPFALNALRKATSLSKPYLVRLEQELARHNVQTTAPDHRQVRASKAVQFRDVLRKVMKIAQDLSKTRSQRPRESVRLSLLSDVHQFLGLEVARAMREVKRLEHTLEGKHKRRRHRRHRGSTDKPEDYVHHNTGECEGGNVVEISHEMVSLTSGASHHAEGEDKHSTRPDEVKTTAGQDSVRQVPRSVASLASAASHHTVAAAPPQPPNDIIPAEDAAGSTHSHHTTPAPSVQLNRAHSHTTPELSDGGGHPRSPPSPSVKSSTHSKEPIPNPVSRTTTRRGSHSTRGTPMPPSETSFDRRISAAHARLDSVEKVLASPSRQDPLSEQNLSRHNFSQKSGSSSSKRSKHGSGTKKDGGDERGSKLSLAAGSEQLGSAKGEEGEEEESKGKVEVEDRKTTSRGTGSRASSHHSRREEVTIKSGTSVRASDVSSSSSKGKPKVEDGKTMSSHASSRHSRREEATTIKSGTSVHASHVSSSSSKGKLKVEDGKTTSSHASTHHSRREEATTMNSGTSVHASHVSSSSSRKGDESKPKSSPSATSEQHGWAKSSSEQHESSKSSSSSSKGKLKVKDGKTSSSHASASTRHSKLKQATPIQSGTSAHASHASSSSSSPSPPPTLPVISKKKSSPSSISSSSTRKGTNNNKIYAQKKSESNIVEVPEQEAGEEEEEQQEQVLSSFTLEQQQQDEMDRERERERDRL